jgi:radical SAM protein with 4Fe4S-binding SPASM domain
MTESFDLVPPLPREIQLEVTGACNLRCQMCLVSYRAPLNKINGSMSFETFRSIVDDLPDLEQVTLQGLGEPLLAPDLFRMIEYASSRGIRMGFNTNGTLLSRDRARRLVDAGLHWLHVSLDGASRETYEGIRRGSDFDRVRTNIHGLVEVKRELGADRPRVQLVFVAMRRNIAELPDLVRLAADWGVESIWVQNLSHSFSDTDPAGAYRKIRTFAATEALWRDAESGVEGRRWFDEASELAAELGVDLRLPRLDEASPTPLLAAGEPGCDWPWRSSYVTHDGVVQPCCMVMGSDRAELGRVDESTGFRAVWENERSQAFRAALKTALPPDVCRGCSMYRGVF